MPVGVRLIQNIQSVQTDLTGKLIITILKAPTGHVCFRKYFYDRRSSETLNTLSSHVLGGTSAGNIPVHLRKAVQSNLHDGKPTEEQRVLEM